jgi:hypothetical protein
MTVSSSCGPRHAMATRPPLTPSTDYGPGNGPTYVGAAPPRPVVGVEARGCSWGEA